MSSEEQVVFRCDAKCGGFATVSRKGRYPDSPKDWRRAGGALGLQHLCPQCAKSFDEWLKSRERKRLRT